MSRAALLVSTAVALVMCATSANAQMQQKQPEGAAPAQMPSAPAEKSAEPAPGKGEPKSQSKSKGAEKSDKGADKGEMKGQPSKGTAQSEPKASPKKDSAQTPPQDQGTKGRAATEPADKGTKGTAQTQPKDQPKDKGNAQAPSQAPSKDKGTAQTESKDKGTKGTASDSSKGAAPKASDQATGPASSGARVQLSQQQRTNLHQTIIKERNVNRVTNVNVAINVGTRVPRSVRLAALPASIIAIVPAYRSYRYFVVDDRICIVDPGTYEIVEVIVADGQTARVEGRGSAALVLTEEEQAVILREIDMRDGSTLALGALTEGSDVPRGVEVRTFPAAVVQQVPKVRDYKFFTAENRIAIVDPNGAKVQLVIEITR